MRLSFLEDDNNILVPCEDVTTLTEGAQAIKKKWTPSEIRDQITKPGNIVWLSRAMKAIYNNQTSDEATEKFTKHRNNIGFNMMDAELLTSFTEQLIQHGRLSKKQWEIARKRMAKYSGQLARIANGEI